MVKWICPPAPLLKLNTDGSCIEGNYGGGGRVLRDSTGNVLMALSLPLGTTTSNQAEVSALLFGLKWCIENVMNQIVAETDSLAAKYHKWNMDNTMED
ncbi:hypothetical protein RDI58_022378 [Solanum bulbocastanum]|uniref:RNase H type-1 domain-containing protein n=1 Tax=Solanum bulbocastanum TaxID=147425 RepID=A0AAN8T2K1_SOLBU